MARMKNTDKTMEKIVALCKGRGFVYPGSEIYGGLANTWDYGPLGVELKENIKKAWRKKFIQENQYNVGLDSAILMNPQTWVASGHLGGFSDPLMDCCECKTRHRADDLIESFDGTNVAGWSNEEMAAYISGEFKVKSMQEASYREVFFSDKDDDDCWYKAKLQFISYDDKTNKEKRSNVTYLLQAKSMHRAINNIDEVMGKTMIDYEIIGLSKTNVYDVFEHKTKEEKEQKSNEEKKEE